MDKVNIQRIAKRVMSAELAGRHTDPHFYSGLQVLPNPDPILRELGQAEEVYSAIASDAHVVGEMRSIRAGVLGYKLRVVDGVEGEAQGQDKAAWELGQWWLANQRPAPRMTWQDTAWNMATAVFYGRSIHELIWQKVDNWILPVAVKDRANRRFKFDIENNLRLLTKENHVEGEETLPYKFVLTRHMPSTENPYGMALFSSCFWPYTFKHGGFRFFYKFCERYGMPWPIGKYPAGTEVKDQQALLDALVQMTEDGAAVIPNDDTVELMSVSHQGELAQESLIHLCNREMSKALTSQTLATEMRNVGSNAASKTHDDRQGRVQETDRFMVADTFNEILRWITLFNFGEGIAPPRFEFFKPKQVTAERLKAWETAADVGRPSRKAFHEEMNIPEADDDEDLLARPTTRQPSNGQPPANFSACPSCGKSHEFAGSDNENLSSVAVENADQAIEDNWIKPAFDMLSQFIADGKSLQEFQSALPSLYGAMDDAEMIDITDQVMELAHAQGMEEIG